MVVESTFHVEWQDAFEWLSQEASTVANRLYNLQALNLPNNLQALKHPGCSLDATALASLTGTSSFCRVPDPAGLQSRPLEGDDR